MQTFIDVFATVPAPVQAIVFIFACLFVLASTGLATVIACEHYLLPHRQHARRHAKRMRALRASLPHTR